MPRDRDVNLNVRVRPDERAKLRALADDRDLTISAVIRHFIRKGYAARFGTKRSTKTTRKERAQ